MESLLSSIPASAKLRMTPSGPCKKTTWTAQDRISQDLSLRSRCTCNLGFDRFHLWAAGTAILPPVLFQHPFGALRARPQGLQRTSVHRCTYAKSRCCQVANTVLMTLASMLGRKPDTNPHLQQMWLNQSWGAKSQRKTKKPPMAKRPSCAQPMISSRAAHHRNKHHLGVIGAFLLTVVALKPNLGASPLHAPQRHRMRSPART